jgi:hypothetical protein
MEVPEMCCLLLESGADPSVEDGDGDSPAGLGALACARQFADNA